MPEATDALLAPDECKIPDVTPSTPNRSFVISSGFPIPEGAVEQVGKVKLWVIPVETSDFSASEQSLADLRESLQKVVEFFHVQSYGRAALHFQIEPDANWVRLPGTAAEFGFGDSRPQQDFSPVMEEILENWTPSGPVSGNDLVMAVLPPVPGVFVAMSTRRFDLKRFNSVLLQNGVLISSGGNEIRTWEVQAHELGHSWLRLEDLYHARADVPYQDYMRNWDIMATAIGPNPSFTAFTRWRSSWIDDSEISCVDPTKPSRHLVELLDASQASTRALIVPTSEHSVIVVDVRRVHNATRPATIVYTVDTSVEHQLGPYRLQAELYREESVQIGGVTVSLIDRDSSGVVIEVGPTL